MTDQVHRLHVRTEALEIAHEARGPAGGRPVILLHGFPDDPRVWDRVATALAANGCAYCSGRRGYGATRLLSPRTLRSGQQAALGADLLGFMDTLGFGRAALAGYDWGGRAACIVAALRPERVPVRLSMNGYNIQDIANQPAPRRRLRNSGIGINGMFRPNGAGPDLRRTAVRCAGCSGISGHKR